VGAEGRTSGRHSRIGADKLCGGAIPPERRLDAAYGDASGGIRRSACGHGDGEAIGSGGEDVVFMPGEGRHRLALLDAHALACRIAVAGNVDRGRAARNRNAAGGGVFPSPAWQRHVGLAQEVESVERLHAGGFVCVGEDFVGGGSRGGVRNLLDGLVLSPEEGRGRAAEDDVFIRILVAGRGKDAACQDAAVIDRANLGIRIENKRHHNRLSACSDLIAEAFGPLASLRHAAIQPHVLDELAHARLELERVETRRHAEESGIAFNDCRVVWHYFYYGASVSSRARMAVALMRGSPLQRQRSAMSLADRPR